jgi:hypothetical protein
MLGEPPRRETSRHAVMVFALSKPSSPSAGLTFVNPPGVQEVVLAHPDNPVVFELIRRVTTAGS